MSLRSSSKQGSEHHSHSRSLDFENRGTKSAFSLAFWVKREITRDGQEGDAPQNGGSWVV